MAQSGFDGLDTPRTIAGDATYLGRRPDFDISHEASFQSPSKDANLFQQLRNGGQPTLRTPRANRAPFADRNNLPASIGGAEFTPLLKSATRNSARRYGGGGGKENGLATPAFLDRIDEDMTPMPAGESSVYVGSRNASSLAVATPLPVADSSIDVSTPLVMRRREGAKGPLDDGNQLSLREQENVIGRIEKENFGLKLKIHFLEEALRKAGPGFSEAALKENTELKVDRVTMQRELQRYKKHLTSAEKDLETYRQQIIEVQTRAKQRYSDQSHRAETDQLRRELEEKDALIEQLRGQVGAQTDAQGRLDRLQDDVADLEAEIRQKDQVIGEHEDEVDKIRLQLEESEDERKRDRRRIVELEEAAGQSDRLEEAAEAIEDLEAKIRELESQSEDDRDKLEDAVRQKNRAENDLEELQADMADKSMVTKGLSRQVEEKVARLQKDLEEARQTQSLLEAKNQECTHQLNGLKAESKTLRQERDSAERANNLLVTKGDEVQEDLNACNDEKTRVEMRVADMTTASALLQREVDRLRRSVSELQESLESERQHALDIERSAQASFKDEIEHLADEISDLQAEIREHERLYDVDSERWQTERQKLEGERDRAMERNAGLQDTIDKLREVEGGLSDRESKLHEAMQIEADRHKREEAMLGLQIEELRRDLESRQRLQEDLRRELSDTGEQLRQAQVDHGRQKERADALEDEVEVLQTAADDNSERERARVQQDRAARLRMDDLEEQLRSKYAPEETNGQVARLNLQVASLEADLAKAARERQAYEEQLTHAKWAGQEVDRLRQEILRLEKRAHSTSDSEDLTPARRVIRELEAQVEDYRHQLASSAQARGGATDRLDKTPPPAMRQEAASARPTELEQLQREMSQRELINSLRRQVSELERKHSSPAESSAESDRLRAVQAMQSRLAESEARNAAADRAADDARQAAAQAAATHAAELERQRHKTDKHRRESQRLAGALRELQQDGRAIETATDADERRDLRAMLRESQTAADALQRDLRHHREALEGVVASETALRKKLERARSERAAYRASSERLQKDVRGLQQHQQNQHHHHRRQQHEHEHRQHVRMADGDKAHKSVDAGAMVRAAEAAEQRHAKEIRGMAMQVSWMQARWERESRLRADAAYAKRYLLLEVQVRDACNKADLVILRDMMASLKGSNRPALQGALRGLNLSRSVGAPDPAPARGGWAHGEEQQQQQQQQRSRPTLRRLGIVARFVVRMQIAARAWARHEDTRRRLAECADEMIRHEREKRTRDRWRTLVRAPGAAPTTTTT